MKQIVLAVALVACAPSSAEIRTAKETTYKMKAPDMLVLAENVAKETYPIGDVDEGHYTFITQAKFYGPEGDLESPGAGGFIQMRDRTVRVQLVVQVVEFGGGDVAVTVTPRTFQTINGSPKPRELLPDDPNLPPFVKGRADQLALDIYKAAKSSAYPANR